MRVVIVAVCTGIEPVLPNRQSGVITFIPADHHGRACYLSGRLPACRASHNLQAVPICNHITPYIYWSTVRESNPLCGFCRAISDRLSYRAHLIFIFFSPLTLALQAYTSTNHLFMSRRPIPYNPSLAIMLFTYRL